MKNYLNFKNKVSVVTGAGSGIGRSLAIKMHNNGAKLALNDFNKQSLDETLSIIGNIDQIYNEVFDVSKKEEFYQFSKNVVSHFKKVDVVINNAGITNGSITAVDTTIESYEKVLGVNLWGMIYGTLAFMPELRKQKESSVVNISSIWGLLGSPYQSAYSTSKFGIRGFTEALAAEELCNNTGVAVTSVHPGGVKTNIVRNIEGQNLTELQLKKLDTHFPTTADETADKIIYAIKKKKSRIVIGPDAKFMYRLSRFSQRITMKFLVNWAKKMMKIQ